MSTWHQQQNPTPLWHATLWTLVFDPPNQTLCIERFSDPIVAERSRQRHIEAALRRDPSLSRKEAERGLYILPPHKEK